MKEPNVEEMLASLKKRAELRGKIKVLELEIKEAEIPIRKASPRKPELRDEATLDLQKELVAVQCELESVEASIEYLEFYMQVWRANMYSANRVI